VAVEEGPVVEERHHVVGLEDEVRGDITREDLAELAAGGSGHSGEV